MRKGGNASQYVRALATPYYYNFHPLYFQTTPYPFLTYRVLKNTCSCCRFASEPTLDTERPHHETYHRPCRTPERRQIHLVQPPDAHQSALVHDLPGLTRDRHYGHGKIGSKPYLVIDTGGFEPVVDSGILHEMAKQTLQAVDEADASCSWWTDAPV